MQIHRSFPAFALALLLSSPVSAQVVSGVMTVTGAEMHWWAGVAREATARLYDVVRRSVVLKKFTEKEKYDIGSITFRARKGRLIDLDKLHESIWATRLSGRTRSGLVSLEVTVVGEVIAGEKETTLKVTGSNAYFVLGENPEDDRKYKFDKLRAAVNDGAKVVSVTGRIADYAGRWPKVLAKMPAKPRRILVTSFKTARKRGSDKRPESKNK